MPQGPGTKQSQPDEGTNAARKAMDRPEREEPERVAERDREDIERGSVERDIEGERETDEEEGEEDGPHAA